ncbi:MAG: hypothetical protein JWP97_1522 [Labilithrix sp.]|nr:hypothetical protein [Labilithrix sp.]
MRSRATITALLSALTVASAFGAFERDASACGGCFSPPSENPTVVTDHRMILTIAKDQSTLYDQIKYSGSPSSFAWVLPISGSVDVGLSSNAVFQTLDSLTQTSIVSPPLNCPAGPSCNRGGFGGAPTSASDGVADAGVTIIKQETVGPYETVQLKATDANALQTWLATNNFNVPADVQPVVNQYVAEHFDFLALRLIPGKNVTDMRPVRVTTKGANAVLPLRMVAAGTGPVVGISLWVVGEGRYEAQNFPTFQIKAEELTWDWTQSKSNYTELRAERTLASAGRGWEVESSTLQSPSQVEYGVKFGYGGADSANDSYLPVKDADGNITKTAEQVREEDLATLFYGVPASTARITRLRSDLAHAALNADLVVTASADQSLLSNIRQVTQELNEPQCPVYNGCDTVGTAPRSEAAARTSANGESFSCSTSPTAPTRSGTAWMGLGAGFLALAIVKAKAKANAKKKG